MTGRRAFLRDSASCAAAIVLWGASVPAAVRELFAARPTGTPLLDEPWGRIEKVGERVWALISTPLAGGADARRTLSNGGIVAGRSGVLLVEGFASDQGAAWIAEQAKTLTGRSPTHVVLTHYHGDHSAGLAGYRAGDTAPTYVTTEVTRSQIKAQPVLDALAQAELVTPDAKRTIDLGGTTVTLTPRAGHTSSDLTVTVEDPHVLFCGDLLWNGMFPNYRDALPSVLSRQVREMLADAKATRVPGHGSIPTAAEAANYVAVIDLVEGAARKAFAAGKPAAEAAKEFKLPESLGPWVMFSPTYYEVALTHWENELKGK